MLNLRSLAFILASAIRRARALSSAALHWFPDRISGRKMAMKIAMKMAVACMSVSYEEFTPSRLGRGIPALSSPRINQRRFRTLPAAWWDALGTRLLLP